MHGLSLDPIGDFTSQNHSLYPNRHHFEGDGKTPCDHVTIANTLDCSHKARLGSSANNSVEAAIEHLCFRDIIDEDQEENLLKFVTDIQSRNATFDIALYEAAMHLRDEGSISPSRLEFLGLESVEKLEAMSLDDLQKYGSQQKRKITWGLVALKFTLINVSNDLDSGDIDRARRRMSGFVNEWVGPDYVSGRGLCEREVQPLVGPRQIAAIHSEVISV